MYTSEVCTSENTNAISNYDDFYIPGVKTFLKDQCWYAWSDLTSASTVGIAPSASLPLMASSKKVPGVKPAGMQPAWTRACTTAECRGQEAADTTMLAAATTVNKLKKINSFQLLKSMQKIIFLVLAK